VVAGEAPGQLLEIKAKQLFSLVFKPCHQNKRGLAKTPDKVWPIARAKFHAEWRAKQP
jgi:hypothetical protein